MTELTRYFQLQECLQAAVLAFLSKHGIRQFEIEELRKECPALVHDDISDEDVRICLNALDTDLYVELNMAGDWSLISYLTDASPEYGEVSDQEWLDHFKGEDEDLEKLEREKFKYIKSVNLSDFGLASLERKKMLKGDKFRFFLKMEDEEIEDYFENLISNSSHLDKIRYPDRNQVVELDKIPEVKADLTEKLDQLLYFIQSNNAVMSNKNSALEAEINKLKMGIEVVKSGKFTIGKIEGALLGCLTFFASKFADAPIGELAQGCWSLVKTSIMHFAT